MAHLNDPILSALCPRTQSKVFVDEALCEMLRPILVQCRVCDRQHVWNPVELSLAEPDATSVTSSPVSRRS